MIPRVARVAAAVAVTSSLVFAATTAGCDIGMAVDRPSPAGAAASDTYCVSVVPFYVVVASWPFELVRGRDYILAGGRGDQGNYGLLEFPDCPLGPCSGPTASGEARLQCLLTHGSPCGSAGQLPTAPGSHSGAVRSAIEARFARDGDRRLGIGFADYHGDGSRVVVVPLTTAPGPGRSMVNVNLFAAFFLKNVPGPGADDTLRGEFIKFIVMGN